MRAQSRWTRRSGCTRQAGTKRSPCPTKKNHRSGLVVPLRSSLSLSLACSSRSVCVSASHCLFFFTLLCSSSSSSSSTTLRLFPPPHSAFSPPSLSLVLFAFAFVGRHDRGANANRRRMRREQRERERDSGKEENNTSHSVFCFCLLSFCLLPSFLARFFIRPPPWLLRVAVFQKREEKRPERGWGKGAGEEWVKEEQESR